VAGVEGRFLARHSRNRKLDRKIDDRKMTAAAFFCHPSDVPPLTPSGEDCPWNWLGLRTGMPHTSSTIN
jgi:hypothetical protein